MKVRGETKVKEVVEMLVMTKTDLEQDKTLLNKG